MILSGMRHRSGQSKLIGSRCSILVLVGLALLGAAFTAEAAPAWNVAYRRIDVQDPVTGELFPAARWYPTRAAAAPLFLTASLFRCRLPAMLCRLVAFATPAEAALRRAHALLEFKIR
jgi:hypothetical protein